MRKRNAAIIGALTVTAAVYLQNYLRGDTPNFVRTATTLFLGALIGLAVAKFVNRNNNR